MDTSLLDAVRSISARDWVALGQVLLRIALIVVAAWAVSLVGNRMFRMVIARLLRTASEDRADRLETLGRVFGNGLSVVVALLVGMLILDVLGISVAPILATAGVVGIAYRESVEEVIEAMRAVGREMRADAAFGPSILEDLEIAGVNEWAGSAIVIRCRFKVKAMQQWGVRRAFLQRLKAAFDAHGIEIPYPHLTVYAGEPKLATAPAFNVRGLPGTAVNEMPHR